MIELIFIGLTIFLSIAFFISLRRTRKMKKKFIAVLDEKICPVCYSHYRRECKEILGKADVYQKLQNVSQKYAIFLPYTIKFKRGGNKGSSGKKSI